MQLAHDPSNTAQPSRASAWLPAGSDVLVLGCVFAALALLYLPTYWDLANSIWQSADQSQGPLMLAASLWLLFERREAIAALPAQSRVGMASSLLLVGLVLYVVGRSQSIWIFEVGSQLLVFSGLLLLFKGPPALRLAWFPIFFLIFMVPLPGPLVAAVTGPLKAGVSYVAAELLFALGYPISRAGVILNVGPYLILVADACAGLTSMFSLEAMGLLYLSIVRHPSAAHNLALSALLVPIAFFANVVRVLVLVLVTYHLGDAAGKGFLHGFAGMVLFVVALMLIVPTDKFIGWVLREKGAGMNIARRKAMAFLAASVASGAGAVAMVPRAGVAEMTAAQPLETLFPSAFGAWKIDPNVLPLEPGAEIRKAVAESYDQTLSRTYVNARGYSVMLSVAYGGRRNQGMDIHRPEICYPAQGLAVRRDTREVAFEFGPQPLTLKRLVAGAGARNEPISYWLVIGNSVASFGYGHRLALLKYGLTGRVPDGMLVRVSSVDNDEAQAFIEQDAFLRDLLAAITPEFRRRLLGQA